MKVQNNNLQEYADNISKNFEERIKKIKAIEYHYDLFGLFKIIDKLSKEEKIITYEMLINDYLEKIKGLDRNMIFDRKHDRNIDDITDFFDYNYSKEDNSEENNKYEYPYCEAQEEAEHVVSDLISKIFNQKGRTLTLPVTIQYIVDYGISGIVPEEDIEKAILWIILKLATIYNYFVEN